jgi:hypothetical protein
MRCSFAALERAPTSVEGALPAHVSIEEWHADAYPSPLGVDINIGAGRADFDLRAALFRLNAGSGRLDDGTSILDAPGLVRVGYSERNEGQEHDCGDLRYAMSGFHRKHPQVSHTHYNGLPRLMKLLLMAARSRHRTKTGGRQ